MSVSIIEKDDIITFRPVEFSRIDDDAGDGLSVAANPFGSAVHCGWLG
jgi:hypothetical protein